VAATLSDVSLLGAGYKYSNILLTQVTESTRMRRQTRDTFGHANYRREKEQLRFFAHWLATSPGLRCDALRTTVRLPQCHVWRASHETRRMAQSVPREPLKPQKTCHQATFGGSSSNHVVWCEQTHKQTGYLTLPVKKKLTDSTSSPDFSHKIIKSPTWLFRILLRCQLLRDYAVARQSESISAHAAIIKNRRYK